MPIEKIVLRLLDDWPDQIEPLSDPPRLCDLLRGPLACAPVERPPVVDDVVHGADGLLDGGGSVGAMAVDDVDVVHVEALEGGLGALDDVLAGEALVVGSGAAPEDLGADDEVGALPPQLADGLAHDLLGAAVGVDLGVVEEVDAVVAAALEEGFRLLHVDLVAEAHPRAVGELAHLEPGPTQVFVLHFSASLLEIWLGLGLMVFYFSHPPPPVCVFV